MGGIPLNAGKTEICAFLHAYDVLPEDVVPQGKGGRQIGVAWVHLPGGASVAQEVVEQLQRQWMGGRYIELCHARRAEAW